ncbi:hypothetical protein ABW21_db0205518 [Orbilia brochopaga]|nr:hypothetical protein ABW21_db0205518 [Drechslerella brochopaga]
MAYQSPKNHAVSDDPNQNSDDVSKLESNVNDTIYNVPSSITSIVRGDLKDSEPVDIPQSSPPLAIAYPLSSAVNDQKDDLLSENLLSEWDETVLATLAQAEKEAEASITKREEDDRFLDTQRHETDYNDLDDDYDLQDDINFEYAGATSPAREQADETREDEKGFRSSQAYRMGLSDPAFDDLQEELDSRYEEIVIIDDAEDDHGEDITSSYLCQAFEDDLKEIEESE